MKARKYSRNPLHVRIPIAIEDTLKSMLENDIFRNKYNSHNKSDIIRRAINDFCQKFEHDQLAHIPEI